MKKLGRSSKTINNHLNFIDLEELEAVLRVVPTTFSAGSSDRSP
jgi:hypothetical protein